MTDEQLMKLVERDQLRRAERDYETARRRFLKAKEAVERAAAKGRDAADALEEAEFRLNQVRRSQESVRREDRP